ncbi:HYC_CC_PP family protein [Flavihumibacter petaseus]|uniref:Secreted protein n=1 Tax=Flavihumibacter petaseus NBRC 106054 TaxID=1220578 RepID=A0A0E9N6P3_9BACT|nr:hypothetical protein [Flavihumibacter petaseus]GAO45468.1 hypothetical protein FPE01S_05_01630 [Flavihumibacter petaseus NBRC 106054]
MKKFIVAIITLLYAWSSTGATVHLHYCMGKLVDWGLSHHDQRAATCSKCGMDKGKAIGDGCCKDEHKQVKVENDHKAASGFDIQQATVALLPETHFILPETSLASIAEQNPVSNAPPRCSAVAVYLRNCTFRI